MCSDFGAQENSQPLFPLFPYLFSMKWWDQITMIIVFWILSFKPTFSLSSFTFIKRLFSPSWLSAIWVASLRIWDYWYFSQLSWFQLVLHPWILLARILEWLAVPFSRGSSQPRSPTLQANSLPVEPPWKPQSSISSVAQLCLTLCDQSSIGRALTKNSAFLIWAVVIYLN